jgi:hypothetical protein
MCSPLTTISADTLVCPYGNHKSPLAAQAVDDNIHTEQNGNPLVIASRASDKAILRSTMRTLRFARNYI